MNDRRELSHFLQRVFDLVNEEIDKNHGKCVCTLNFRNRASISVENLEDLSFSDPLRVSPSLGSESVVLLW